MPSVKLCAVQNRWRTHNMFNVKEILLLDHELIEKCCEE